MAKLECLGAKHGDCLVLHHGSKKILFDGGPSGVYHQFLKKWIAENKPPGGPLVFDLGMVTHIDDDHINGLLALANDMGRRLDDAEPQDVSFKQFWFNSFSGLTGQDFHSASVAEVVASASTAGFNPHSGTFDDSRTGAIIASVSQGHKLSNSLSKLGLGGNGTFNGLVQGHKEVELANDLVLDVIGPQTERLQQLREEWDEEIPVGTIAAFTDKSVPNLSSIVIMIKAGDKKLLMTGDARGDDILKYLEDADYPIDGTMELDVLKTPHHGSDRNVTLEFFKALPAKTYVISADGAHGNPDSPTIQWIAEARGNAPFEFVFASPMKTAAKQEELENQLEELKTSRNFTWRFRKSSDLSIDVDL